MKNACIVGYGCIGPIHAQCLSEDKFANLYAICDIVNEKADEGAKKYNAKAYYNYNEVLKDDKIDVVHICTPHYLHVKMAIEAMRAGKDIVLEKPIAITEDELNTLVCEYEKQKSKICVVFQNRTNNSIVALKKEIETDKSLGELKGIFANMRWNRDEKYYAHDAWRGKWATEGGGVLINQSIHLLDLILLFSGAPKSIIANMSTKLLKNVIEVEDTFDAVFQFENDLKCVFYATNTYSTSKPFSLELNFENATLRYADNVLYKVIKNSIDVNVIGFDNEKTPGKDVWGSGHKKVISSFYSFLAGNNTPYMSLSDALLTTKVMQAMYKSAKNGGKKIEL